MEKKSTFRKNVEIQQRLSDAAPAMLGALRLAMETLDDIYSRNKDNGAWAHYDPRPNIAAAIAMATGGAI